jgi:hypothetical protein
VDDPAIWVERYGPAADGTAYFALRNPGSKARTVTLTVEPTAFGRFPSDLTAATEVLSGQDLAPEREAGKVLVTMEVAGEDTAVVKLNFAP